MEPIDQLAHILPTLSSTVDRNQARQLSDPTPCTDFTVHDVLDHMIVLGGTFADRTIAAPAGADPIGRLAAFSGRTV